MVGGHVAALPEHTLQEEAADFVCSGEGPYTVLELLETLKSGRLITPKCGVFATQRTERFDRPRRRRWLRTWIMKCRRWRGSFADEKISRA